MTKPISVQLYSVRDALPNDLEGVIRKIAGFGYQGVEPFDGLNPKAQMIADLCKSLGMQIPSAHGPLPVGEKRAPALEAIRQYGCKYLVCPSMPSEEFKSVEGVKRVCDQLNEANKVARDAGVTLGYHNHWFEYEPVGGTYGYKIMAERLDPSIIFEIDTYWAKVGGCDPVAVIKELGSRVKLLHIKDGPADNKDSAMVAVGEGVMDVPAILDAGTSAEWLVVELDRCATDMLEAVGKSYHNLEELARASKN